MIVARIKSILKILRAFSIFIDKIFFASLFTFFLKIKPGKDLIIVAHRGASKYAPENTIAAFQKALELGANGIECDVIFTRDNIPIVAHHKDLSNRVPAEQRPAIINEMDINAVKKLDVGLWFSKEYKGERIPTLKEVLLFLKGKVERVYLHDKVENNRGSLEKDRIRIFAEEIRNSSMKNQVIVMVESGDLSVWRKVAPDIPLLQCWVGPWYQNNRIKIETSFSSGIRHMGVYHGTGQLSFFGRIISMVGFYNLGCFIGFWPDKKIVDRYKINNCDFTVFTINEKLTMKLYLNAGFSAIGTDDPLLLFSVLDSRNGK